MLARKLEILEILYYYIHISFMTLTHGHRTQYHTHIMYDIDL